MSDFGKEPRLSIAVLNYNYGHFLGLCLDSLLAQSMTDFEIIIIDDASTDNSLEIVQPYLADSRVRLISHSVNRGFAASLIEGSEAARAPFLTVVSADDLAIDTDAFALILEPLSDNEVSFAYSVWTGVDDHGRTVYRRRPADHSYVATGEQELERLVRSTAILHSGTVIRRSAYDTVGGYDPTCQYALDNNMWLALCTVGKVAFVNRSLFAYRGHGANMSTSDGALEKTTVEMLRGIDSAFDRLTSMEISPAQAHSLRSVARRRALVSIATVDIMSGRYRRGWRGWQRSFRLAPFETSVQPRTLTLLARTLLGRRVFRAIRGVYPERNTMSEENPA